MLGDALRNPDRFFRERTPKLAFPQTLAVVFLVTLVTTASVGVMGRWLSQRITATTLVDNPDRPTA
jgi:hypothetical protein